MVPDNYVEMHSGDVEKATSVMPGLKDPITSANVKAETASPLDVQLKKRLEQYDSVVESAKELFSAKNRKYRDGIARTGVLGAAVEVIGVAARIEGIVLASNDAGESQADDLVDLIKDLVNYGAIMGIMVMDDNWKPK